MSKNIFRDPSWDLSQVDNLSAKELHRRIHGVCYKVVVDHGLFEVPEDARSVAIGGTGPTIVDLTKWASSPFSYGQGKSLEFIIGDGQSLSFISMFGTLEVGANFELPQEVTFYLTPDVNGQDGYYIYGRAQ